MATSGKPPALRYSLHIEEQMAERGIDHATVALILEQADDYFYDLAEGTLAATKSMLHEGVIRDIVLVYRTEEDGTVVLITIHPLKPRQKEHRIRSGRWISGK